MSYATRFRYDYREAYPESLGRSYRRFRVSFKFRDYSGEITELLPGASPYHESITDSSDTRFAPINPWKFSFDLACQAYWDAQAFYVSDDTQIQVLIEIDPTGLGTSYATHRVGYISATDLKEPYGPKPYTVSVSALDGLSLLKTRPMLDASGKRFKGQISVSHAIWAALALTGIDLPLVIGDNLYNLADMAVGQTVDGHADPARCPLYQTFIDSERFIDSNNTTRMAWDVLKELLEPRGARLSQNKGQWWVIRGDETGGGWDVGDDATSTSIHTRTYTSSTLSAAPTSHQSRELGIAVSRTGTTRVHEGTTWLPQYQNGVLIKQDFGRYLSKVPGFDPVDGTLLPVGYTANNLLTASRFVSGSGTDLDQYALTIMDAGDEKFNQDTPYVHIKLDYGTQGREYTRFNKRTWEGEAELTNLAAAKMVFIAERDDAPYLLTGGDWKALSQLKSADMVGILNYNVYTDPITGHSVAAAGRFKYSIDLGTIDRVRALHIYYCMGESLTHYDNAGNTSPETGQTSGIRPKIKYYPGRLIVQQQGQQLDGKQETIVRPKQTVPDTTLSISVGDVPDAAYPYDRIGSTFGRHVDLNVSTSLWFYPDADILDPNPTGRNVGKTQLRWLAEVRASQILQPAASWEGTLLGDLPDGIHTVVRINDLGGPDGSGGIIPYTLAITRIGDSDTRLMEHKVTLTRIMPMLEDFDAFDQKADWQTPDGLIPISFDAAGKETAPGTITLSDLQKLKQRLSVLGFAKPTIGISPSVAGFSNIQGAAIVGAQVYNGAELKGTVKAALMKQLQLKHYI